MEAPTFDPNAEFEDVTSHAEAAAPTFDPNAPFHEVRAPSRLGADFKQLGIGAAEGFLETPDVVASMVERGMPGMGPAIGLAARTGAKLFNKAIGNEGPDQTYTGGFKHLLGEYNPDLYPAQGLEQKVFRTVGSALGSPLTYTGPGGVATKVGYAIPSAVTSELAGTAAEGTKYEPLARIAGAAAVPTAASGARRLFSPAAVPAERAAARDALAREGVEVSASQLTGNESLRYKEATSGRPYQRFQERQRDQLTRAAIRSIGEDGDNVHDAIARARPRIGQELDDATANIRVRWDPQFQADITPIEAQLRREGYAKKSETYRRVNALLSDAIGAFDFVPRGKRVAPGPDHMEMSGEALLERVRHSSALSRASREGGTVGAYADMIKKALYDLADRTAHRGGTREETGDRAAFQRFQESRRQWKNLLALEDVISSAGDVAAAGKLTPAMVRRLATFSEKSDYGRGRSDFSELARNANMLMPPVPQSGTAPRMQLGTRALGAGIGSMLGGGGGPWFSGLGAGIGGYLAPMIEGRAVMSPWGQRYLSQGRFAPRSLEEHLARTGRAAAPALEEGYAEGGEVEEMPNPYSSLPPESQARMDDAYNTSIERWKQLGKDVFFAPSDAVQSFLRQPTPENALGVIPMGGLKWAKKAPRATGAYAWWTPAEEEALAKYIKSDALAIPDALAHRSETALQQRAKEMGLVPRATEKYKRQRGDAVKAPAPQPDFLDLAYEPRQAVLFIERAAAQGSLQAKAMLNQIIQTAPTKRDPLIQMYIERLQKAGWKPGMKRGGAVRRNPYARVA